MINNYLVIRRFLFENLNFFKTATLFTAFSQEKDRIVLGFEKDSVQRWLEVSFRTEGPYLTFHDRYTRAKKNTISFFKSFLPCQVISVNMHKNDRIIRFDTSEGALLAFLRPLKGNLIFRQSNKAWDIFLKGSELREDLIMEGLGKEMEEVSSLVPFYINDFDKYASEKDIRKVFPYINSAMFEFLQVFSQDGYGLQRLKNFISNTLTAKLYIVGSPLEKMKILPEILVGDKEILAVSDNVTDIYRKYRSLDHTIATVRKTDSSLLSKFLKDRDYLEKKLEHTQKLVSKGDRSEEYKQKAELILINIGMLKRGLKSIQVENVFQEGIIEIELAEDLTPEQNAEEYFRKSKQAKITFQKAQAEIPLIKKRLEEINNSIEKLQNMTLEEMFSQKSDSIKPKTFKAKGSTEEGNNFRKYLLPGGFLLYVGKDSKNNDELTFHFAKQEDVWLHARGVSGSHVIIRNPTKGIPVPKNIIKLAAAIAAYHSKAKTAGIVPVIHTFKKYVVKKKGMNPGQVAVLREEVVLVRPEIPAEVIIKGKEN